MSVTVAKTAGFCFGVRRAVDLAEQQAKKNGKIYAYGEIIHNMHEIERLEKLGVYTAHALEDIPDGSGARCTTECIHAASSKKVRNL